jgi:hypothetical protein
MGFNAMPFHHYILSYQRSGWDGGEVRKLFRPTGGHGLDDILSEEVTREANLPRD